MIRLCAVTVSTLMLRVAGGLTGEEGEAEPSLLRALRFPGLVAGARWAPLAAPLLLMLVLCWFRTKYGEARPGDTLPVPCICAEE